MVYYAYFEVRYVGVKTSLPHPQFPSKSNSLDLQKKLQALTITTNDSYLKRNFFTTVTYPVYNWLCVDLELNCPYFFVEYMQNEGSSRLTSRKIVGSLSDLEEICKRIQQDDKLQLIQVSLLSPTWLNNTDCWGLNTLSEVQFGNFGQKEPWVQIFTLQDGRQLIDANLNLDIEDALEIHPKFSVQAYK